MISPTYCDGPLTFAIDDQDVLAMRSNDGSMADSSSRNKISIADETTLENRL